MRLQAALAVAPAFSGGWLGLAMPRKRKLFGEGNVAQSRLPSSWMTPAASSQTQPETVPLVSSNATPKSAIEAGQASQDANRVSPSMLLDGTLLPKLAAEWCQEILQLLPVPGPARPDNFKVTIATMCSGSELLHWVHEAISSAVSAATGVSFQIEQLWACEIVEAKAEWCDKVVPPAACIFKDCRELCNGAEFCWRPQLTTDAMMMLSIRCV